jgi:DNA-binding XRE family transcriptional regulator
MEAVDQRETVRATILARRGTLVAARRSERGLSQAGLARVLDPPCDQSTISGIERGEQDVSVWLAARLAPSLGLTIEELLAAEVST